MSKLQQDDNVPPNPSSLVENCKGVVAAIERELDTVSKLQFTISILRDYEKLLTEVITNLQSASDQEVRRYLPARSAVLESLRYARDELALALIQLTEKEGRQNRQFFNALNNSHRYLAEALELWFLDHEPDNKKASSQQRKRTSSPSSTARSDPAPVPAQPDPQSPASRSPSTTPNSPGGKRAAGAGFVHGYALIIGVADYADYRINALYEEVVKDAMEMHNVLRAANLCSYPNDHVKLLYDNARDKAATLANIRNHLSWLAQAANADGDATAIFYFSGHGERIEIDGQVSYYLYPYDCNADDLEGTALKGTELSQLLHAIRAPRLLVILDSCYSGGIDAIKGPRRGRALLKGEPHEDDYRQLAQGQGRVIIASSRPSETSRALPDLNNSLLTHYLVEGLQGKAHSQGDGLLRVNDVYNYASAQVSQHRPQHPVITSHTSENFPIALYLGGKQTASSTFATDSVDLTALREDIVRAFSLEDLRTLCADITQALRRDGKDELISLDLLEGSGLRAKAQSLGEYCERRGYFSYLITAVCKARPNLDICKQ